MQPILPYLLSPTCYYNQDEILLRLGIIAMALYTDTHCHLDFDRFDEDREDMLKRAWEAGLVWMLNPGIDIKTNHAAILLSKRYPGRINAAVGIHPNYGKPWTTDLLQNLRQQAQQPEVVAIGEIGLDYYRHHTPREQQKIMFQAQLDLAMELSLPVIIHNRDSIHDLLPILKAWHQRLTLSNHPLAQRPGVLHSYSGDFKSAMTAITMNFFIGISGPVTLKNAQKRKEVTRDLPIGKILLETDSPFLAPHPHRGKRNEPAFIPLIASEIAQLKNTHVTTVAEITHRNAQYLFNSFQ